MTFNRIIVTENGIKQEGQQWGSDHGLEIDQFNVERLEIIKGAASLNLPFQIKNALNTNYLNYSSRYRILNIGEQGRNFVLLLQWEFNKK